MDITLYTFEDEDGNVPEYHTYNAQQAEDTARKNGWLVIDNTYEWQESVPVTEWDYRPSKPEDEDDETNEDFGTDPDADYS